MTQGTGEPRRLAAWFAVPAAAAGGYLLDVASPALGWWPAAFLGAALILAALWQQRAWAGAVYGLLAGAAFWLPHISWLTLYLGPVPWLGLCFVMVVWFGLFGAVVAVTTGGWARWVTPWWALIVVQSLSVAGLWVARESIQSSWPYGGFAWGRLALTQADGPLAQSVSWVGFAGLSGILALACALPVAAWGARSRRSSPGAHSGRWYVRGGVSLGAAVALLLVLAVIPPTGADRTGMIRVAGVQGNSKSGIFDDRDSGDVLADHLAATEQLLDDLERSGDSVDVIVWPENSGEFDFPGNPLGALRVAKLAERAEAPIVVGAVLANDDGSYSNSMLVWGPDGSTGERYDKRFPVPFAEYMPNREFFHALAPDLVDLVQLEYAPGTGPAAVNLDTASGSVRAGVAICFDVTFDDQAVAMLDSGAEVILAPTNNADFGRTDESAQQLSIARLRAIETGRSVVNVSTVGMSSIIASDGKDRASIEPFTSGAMVADVPLVAGSTPALRFGSLIAGGWMLLGAGGLLVGSFVAARTRRARRKCSLDPVNDR